MAKDMTMDSTAQGVVREYKYLSGNRGNWESHWQEIAERVIPSQSQLFHTHGSLRTQGEKRTEFLFDSTAASALNKFSAILDSLLTPRNQTWHKLKASDPAGFCLSIGTHQRQTSLRTINKIMNLLVGMVLGVFLSTN
jgi:hypothetical protein